MKNLFLLIFILLGFNLIAQVKFPPLSPEGSIRQKVGVTAITVTYERPAARGRKIFGELVPYNTLWRTGAGNCTRIKFNDDVVSGNTVVKAGTYSLFTIPDPQEWIVILNSDTTLYGTGGYDEGKDVLRFSTKPMETDRYYESLTIDIDVIPEDAQLNISWERTRIAFEIKTQTDKKVAKMVNEQLLSGKISDPQLLAMGAEYYYFLGNDMDVGLTLVNKALAIESRSWYYTLKIDMLTKSKRYPEAIEALKLHMVYVKTNPENWNKDVLDNVMDGQKLQLRELQSIVKN